GNLLAALGTRSSSRHRLHVRDLRQVGEIGFAELSGDVRPLAIDAAARTLLALAIDGDASRVIRWDIAAGREQASTVIPPLDRARVNSRPHGADNKPIAVGVSAGEVSLLNLPANPAVIAPPIPFTALSMAFPPHDPILALGKVDGTTVFWNAALNRP